MHEEKITIDIDFSTHGTTSQTNGLQGVLLLASTLSQHLFATSIFSLFFQIVFFSFCRGGLRAPKKPKASRSYNSWESTILPGLIDSCDFEPAPNQLRSGERAREWQIHPFPAVVLPTQVFVIYSTLEDSK